MTLSDDLRKMIKELRQCDFQNIKSRDYAFYYCTEILTQTTEYIIFNYEINITNKTTKTF